MKGISKAVYPSTPSPPPYRWVNVDAWDQEAAKIRKALQVKEK